MPSSQPYLAPPQTSLQTAPVTIAAQELTVSYGNKSVLRNVDFRARRGEVTALIGPSGCGKTTLLNCINRLTDLIPSCRVQGSLSVEGREVLPPATPDLIALRKQVGMVFQKPNPFPMTVARNISLPLRHHGLSSRTEIQQRTERALREVGLWEEIKDRLNSPATQLSGGQKQRLCLARALALQPRVILMDEPCSALDPLATATIEEHIRRLREDYTVVIVTHNLGQARRLADTTYVLWNHQGAGYVADHGPTTRVFDHPANEITAAYVQGLSG